MSKETTKQVMHMVERTSKMHVYNLIGIAKGSLDNKCKSHKWSKAEVFFINHLYDNFTETKAPEEKKEISVPPKCNYMARDKKKRVVYRFKTKEKRDSFLKRHEDIEFELIDRK